MLQMPRPPSEILEARFSCNSWIDDAAALRACEISGSRCGFSIASRTQRSLVFMPGPRRKFMRCIGGTPGASHSAMSGKGMFVDVVRDNPASCLAIAVTTSQSPAGQAFVDDLEAHLQQLASRTPRFGNANADENEGGAEVFFRGDSSAVFRLEAQAYYCTCKVLFDAETPPGSAVAEFTRDFATSCSAMSPTALEQGRPMAICLATVDRLHSLLEEHLAALPPPPSSTTSGLVGAEQLRPWLRSSVERCLFGRVGGSLWQLYKSKSSAEDAQFAARTGTVAAKPDEVLLHLLEVRKEFCVLDFAPSEDVLLPCSSSSTTVSTKDTDGLPSTELGPFYALGGFDVSGKETYSRASAALSQVEVVLGSASGCIPRQALEALEFAQLEMKTCAFETSGGRVELVSMDDILPLFIFLLLRSSLASPLACARLLHDSLSSDERLSAGGRAVALLDAAARHVAFDWMPDLDDWSGGEDRASL